MMGDLTVHMPASLCQRLDRASMAHSLEARVPFLSHSFVDWALTIPSSLKLKGNVGKYVLAASGRAVAAARRARSAEARLPDAARRLVRRRIQRFRARGLALVRGGRRRIPRSAGRRTPVRRTSPRHRQSWTHPVCDRDVQLLVEGTAARSGSDRGPPRGLSRFDGSASGPEDLVGPIDEQPDENIATPRARPLVWLMLGNRRGDNNQLLALADGLGLPFETKAPHPIISCGGCPASSGALV